MSRMREKNYNKGKEYILNVIILLVIIQIARIVIKYVFFSQLNLSLSNLNIVNIVSIMLVGISTSLILRENKLFNSPGQRLINLNNRYNNKNIRLIVGTVTAISACLMLYFDDGYLKYTLITSVLMIIIQPIFEEIIFREYIWHYISIFEKNENKVLVIVTILFAIFKIGYFDIVNQNLNIIGSSFFAVDVIISNVILGLITGFILGIIKIKYRDTYLCIIVHALMNIFIVR